MRIQTLEQWLIACPNEFCMELYSRYSYQILSDKYYDTSLYQDIIDAKYGLSPGKYGIIPLPDLWLDKKVGVPK